MHDRSLKYRLYTSVYVMPAAPPTNRPRLTRISLPPEMRVVNGWSIGIDIVDATFYVHEHNAAPPIYICIYASDLTNLSELSGSNL